MNQPTSVSSTWNAFVFGAIFNVVAASPDEPVISYVIKTVAGGLIWLAFQIIADRIKHINTQNQEEKDEQENKEEKK